MEGTGQASPERPKIESRCNTKTHTHTLVGLVTQLARSKYIKEVNRFKNAFMSSKV